MILTLKRAIINDQEKRILSICELKDKRIASSSENNLIMIYRHSYDLQFTIGNAHEHWVHSLCVLKNGELVSSSSDRKIKIWRINEKNYNLIYTLIGHNGSVYKVIELKDGKMCSCSGDKTIKIWDNYQCITTISTEHSVKSIIEMKDYIISAFTYVNTFKIWNKLAFECTKTIKNVFCCDSSNILSKIDNSTILVGGYKTLYLIDIKTFNVNQFQEQTLGKIFCCKGLKNGLVLFGNSNGEIYCYDIFSNQIISKKKCHEGNIYCIIETEDNKIISSSGDAINIYQ